MRRESFAFAALAVLVVLLLGSWRGHERPRPAEKWQGPSEFDLAKELNAHVGRVATMVAFLLAATSFTVGTIGLVHDIAVGQRQIGLTESFLVAFLGLLGVSIYFGCAGVLGAMMAPVLPLGASQLAWQHEIESKTNRGWVTVRFLGIGLFSIGGTWWTDITLGSGRVPPTTEIMYVMATVMLLGALLGVTGHALWRASKMPI